MQNLPDSLATCVVHLCEPCRKIRTVTTFHNKVLRGILKLSPVSEVVLTKSSIVHAAWTKLQVPATRTTPSPWIAFKSEFSRQISNTNFYTWTAISEPHWRPVCYQQAEELQSSISALIGRWKTRKQAAKTKTKLWRFKSIAVTQLIMNIQRKNTANHGQRVTKFMNFNFVSNFNFNQLSQ